MGIRAMTPVEHQLDEDAIENWIARQVEDGHMDVERLPLLMARYALATPAQMKLELSERMGMDEDNDLDEDDNPSPVFPRP